MSSGDPRQAGTGPATVRSTAGPDNPAGRSDQEAVLLESGVSLSQSLIWRLQREFYAQRGLKAWTEDSVPSFITNNPFISEIYARVVAAFLCDCMELGGRESGPLSSRNPLRILELGAGHGKFSYLFLRHLAALLREKGIAFATVRYCMTDCSESLLQSWRANSYLAEFVQYGMLEFELLKIDGGEEIKSQFVTGRDRGASGAAAGPLVLIANYVFDSLPQDAFVIQDGQIFEALITAAATAPGQSGGDGGPAPGVEALSGLRLSYKNVSVSADRYPHQSWNEILERYRSRLRAATVLFPSAALKTLHQLAGLTDGRMLVLAADKGHVHETDLASSQGEPALEWHAANCFSQMVNFDAIGKYFASIGGDALLPDKHSASLSICAFLQGRPGDRFPATRTVYRAAQESFGPDDLFTLLAWLNAHMEEMAVPQILATLRLTRWDPTALVRLFPVLARQLRTVVRERDDLHSAVLRTWANHYPVGRDENVVAFDCAVILLELRFFADALSMFQASQQVLGPSAATSYNLGLCALGLGRADEALAFMVEACGLDPNFEPARTTRAKLESETRRAETLEPEGL